MSIRLRYFDTSPLHRHFWPQLDSRFRDIAGAYAVGPEAAEAHEDYFARILPTYAGPEPLLLIYHVGETYAAGEHQGMYRNLSLTDWQAWSDTARKLVFILFVSGGGRADLAVQEDNLPTSYCHGWPERMGQAPGIELKDYLKKLILSLENQMGQASPQLEWNIDLNADRFLPEQEAWLDCLHELSRLINKGPEHRQAAITCLAAYKHNLLQVPEELSTLEASLHRSNADEILQLCQQVSNALGINKPVSQLTPAPCPHPPPGYEQLLWVDDHPEPELLQQLRSQGYIISGPVSEIEAGRKLLSRPGTLICDIQLQSESDGLSLIQEAQALQHQVIAISRRPRQLPEGIHNACGLLATELPEHLHRQLWELARSQNISNCLYRCHEEVFLY